MVQWKGRGIFPWLWTLFKTWIENRVVSIGYDNLVWLIYSLRTHGQCYFNQDLNIFPKMTRLNCIVYSWINSIFSVYSLICRRNFTPNFQSASSTSNFFPFGVPSIGVFSNRHTFFRRFFRRLLCSAFLPFGVFEFGVKSYSRCELLEPDTYEIWHNVKT